MRVCVCVCAKFVFNFIKILTGLLLYSSNLCGHSIPCILYFMLLKYTTIVVEILKPIHYDFKVAFVLKIWLACGIKMILKKHNGRLGSQMAGTREQFCKQFHLNFKTKLNFAHSMATCTLVYSRANKIEQQSELVLRF